MDRAEIIAAIARLEAEANAQRGLQRTVINGHQVHAIVHSESDGEYVAFSLNGKRCARRGMIEKIGASVGGWTA